jgi:hypoxanthine phosphoribosyltransferase
MAEPMREHEHEMLFSREDIAARVKDIGAQISRDFAGEAILLVGVLKGAAVFLADLARSISVETTFDFVAISSYKGVKTSWIRRSEAATSSWWKTSWIRA